MKNTLEKILIVLKDGKVSGAQCHFSEPFSATVNGQAHTFPAGIAVPVALVTDDTLRPQLVDVLGEVTVAALATAAECVAQCADMKACCDKLTTERNAAVELAKPEATKRLEVLQRQADSANAALATALHMNTHATDDAFREASKL